MSKTMIAGVSSNIIGEKNSPLILRGTNIRIQWGEKFIDLIKNGKIACEQLKFIQMVSSEDEMSKDGIYLIEEDIYLYISGNKFKIKSEENYLSISTDLILTEEEKNKVLTNIGIYYETLKDLEESKLQNGLVYIKSTNELYTLNNGIATNITSQMFPKGGIIMWSGTIIPEGWVLCDGNNSTPNLIKQFVTKEDVQIIDEINNTDISSYELVYLMKV